MGKHIAAWISTTPGKPWTKEPPDNRSDQGNALSVTEETDQKIEGFGGCFNELGMIALRKLPKEKQSEIFKELFDAENGCAFSLCRVPIGASDYAADWYSHDEFPDDFEMKRFSIDRDRVHLLPYIKEALTRRRDLRFFASPWSPPTWMKQPAVYNYGRLRMEDSVLKAYALYFKRFLEAYAREGVKIEQIHVQNEPFADQKFPSCLWSADQFIVFIRDYLGPLFEKEKVDAEIWLGTLNGPELMRFNPFDGNIILDSYDEYVDKILLDEETRKFIAGIGYQWGGRANIQRTHESFPELRLMQTENECGDGNNTWAYAFYVFNLMRHYLVNGAEAYTYWNMVLEDGGASTWGWRQNSMITILPEEKTYRMNPEFYVMKHFSRFVAPGAVRLRTKGRWTSSATAFKNPDGSIVLVASNQQNYERPLTIELEGNSIASATLKPRSINTIVLE